MARAAEQSNLNGVDAVINLAGEPMLINAGLTSEKSVSAKAAGIHAKTGRFD